MQCPFFVEWHKEEGGGRFSVDYIRCTGDFAAPELQDTLASELFMEADLFASRVLIFDAVTSYSFQGQALPSSRVLDQLYHAEPTAEQIAGRYHMLYIGCTYLTLPHSAYLPFGNLFFDHIIYPVNRHRFTDAETPA